MRAHLALTLLLLASGARAQTPPERAAMAGAWWVEGQASLRYLGALPGGLFLEGAWDEALGEVRLAQVAAGEGAWRLEGRRLQGPLGERLALELRRAEGDALEAVLRVDGKERDRERWRRAGPPRLELLAVGAWSPTGAAGPGLVIDLAVDGRPQPVTVRVRAAEDDARYAALGGIVHEELLLAGRPLPVGTWRLFWDGRDRSAEERPVRPGAYAVELVAAEPGLGARTPGAGPALSVRAPATIPAEPAPAPARPAALGAALAVARPPHPALEPEPAAEAQGY